MSVKLSKEITKYKPRISKENLGLKLYCLNTTIVWDCLPMQMIITILGCTTLEARSFFSSLTSESDRT
jgi:hypothetical protein